MKTLLLDLKAYLADSNSRRSLLSVRAATDSNKFGHDVLTFPPLQTELQDVYVVADNKITVINTSRSLKIELTTPTGVVTLPAVNGILVFPAPVTGIKVQNEGTSDVDAIIIQQ